MPKKVDKPKPFICHHGCGAAYTTSQSLSRHFKDKHPDKPGKPKGGNRRKPASAVRQPTNVPREPESPVVYARPSVPPQEPRP